MQIGKFDKTREGFGGVIRTLGIYELVRIAACEKKSEHSPDFRLYLGGGEEIGVAWEKKTAEGRPYLSVVLDDPSFPETVNAGLFEGDRGSFNLIWTRRKDA